MADISNAPNWVFDANQFAPDQGQQAIPADKYPVVISNTELKPTKDAKGAYFDVSYQVTEGPFASAIVHDRFNIINDNAQTVKIAHGQLSALCHCVGIYNVSMNNHGANLRGARLVVDVIVKAGEQGPMNDVRRRYDQMGNEPGKAGQRPMAAPGPAIPGQAGGFPGAAPQGWGAQPQPGPAAPQQSPVPIQGWPAQHPQPGPQPQWQGQPQGNAQTGPQPGFAPQPGPQPGFAPQPAQAAPQPQQAPQGGPSWGAPSGQPTQGAPQPQPQPAQQWAGQQPGPGGAPAWSQQK